MIHQQVLNPSPDPTYIYPNVDRSTRICSNIDCSVRIYSNLNTSISDYYFHKMPYSVVTMKLEVTSRDRMGTK